MVQRCQGLRLHQPGKWRRPVRPLPRHPGRRLQVAAGRPEGHLHLREGAEGHAGGPGADGVSLLHELARKPASAGFFISPDPHGSIMAKPNYSFEKRQREIAKKKKTEEKEAKKRAQREMAKNGDAPKEGSS